MLLKILMPSAAIVAFIVLGFMLNRTMKNYEANKKTKRKKGKNRYMPEVKKLGR